MRLYSFLNEAINNVETEINKDEFYKLLKEKCKNNLKDVLNSKSIHIYRGIKIDDRFLKFTGNKIRKSANTSNYYTILFSDILESWKNIPKRNKSLICTTDYIKASEYGQAYLVIPYDNTKIAYCDADDFWNITMSSKILWQNSIRQLTYINTILSKLKIKDTEIDIKKFLDWTIYNLDEYAEKNIDSNLDDVVNILKNLAISCLDKRAHILDTNKNIKKHESKLKSLKFYDVFNDILNPKNLDVGILNYKDLNFDNEVWMDQPALLIRMDSDINEIIDEISDEIN